MTTTLESRVQTLWGENRVVIREVGWAGYLTLLDMVGDKPPRITYDRGDAELMSPLFSHELYRSRFGFAVEAITEELRIPRVTAGSTTYKSQLRDRGLEPDEAFYLSSAAQLRHIKPSDLTAPPSPDLAIEIEITRSALDRMGIYAALGVPEVWRFDGEALSVHLLSKDGNYELSDTSAAFPFVPMGEIVRWVSDEDCSNDSEWGRAFRTWVREVIVPRARGDVPEGS
jgi:Uma2 family endonuclease